MVGKEVLKNNKNIYKQSEENITKMQHDVVKFCLELGWNCWIGNKEVVRGNDNNV